MWSSLVNHDKNSSKRTVTKINYGNWELSLDKQKEAENEELKKSIWINQKTIKEIDRKITKIIKTMEHQQMHKITNTKNYDVHGKWVRGKGCLPAKGWSLAKSKKSSAEQPNITLAALSKHSTVNTFVSDATDIWKYYPINLLKYK